MGPSPPLDARPRGAPGLLALVTAAGLLVAPPPRAAGPRAAGGPEDLARLVREWVGVRSELGRVEGDWREKRPLLEDEARMLERRRDALREALEAARREDAGLGRDLEEARAARKRSEGALAGLEASLARAEAYLRTWSDRLPPFLLLAVDKDLRALPPPGAPGGTDTVAERLERVLRLHAQLEGFGSRVHAGKLVIAGPGGREREMDVLLLGLALGWAVSAEGDAAAAGRMTPRGLVWRWDPGLAGAVREAWASFRKERPPGFVDLPLRIGGEEGR